MFQGISCRRMDIIEAAANQQHCHQKTNIVVLDFTIKPCPLLFIPSKSISDSKYLSNAIEIK
jgi:hypothetical protein